MDNTDYVAQGGAAFPLSVPTDFQFANQGMTLRDWFAGQVLAGMAARDDFDPGQATPEQRARLAYIDADAMLRERVVHGT